MKSIKENTFFSFKTLKNFDLFGQQITLNNQEQSYKTIFGGLSSIIILAILIATFQSNISAFFA